MAQVVSLLNTVWITSRLSSTLLCGGHPARVPTSGSDAYLNNAHASESRHLRSNILSDSIITITYLL